MYESCEHTETLDDRREYCELEAMDPAGDVAIVTELIDTLLYDKENARSDVYQLSSDRSLQMLRRVVTHAVRNPYSEAGLQKESGEKLPEEVKVKVSLCHQINKVMGSEHYGIDISWGVESQINEGRYSTEYFMDIFPNGRVLTCLDEPDLGRIDEELNVIPANGGRHERPMTPFDYTKLFDELGLVYDIQVSETTGR